MSGISKDDQTSGQHEKVNTKAWLLFFIFFILIFIFVIYYFQEIKKDVRLLERVNVLWLAIAILAQVLTYFFTAAIYRVLLRSFGVTQLPSRWNMFKAAVISQFFNQAIPGAQLSGNTFIFNFLIKYNIKAGKIIYLILTELLIYYLAMEAVIVVFFGACLSFYEAPRVFTITLATGFVVYLVFATLITLARKKKFLDRLYNKLSRLKFLKKLSAKINSKLLQQSNLENEKELKGFFKRNKKAVAKCFLLQLLVITADALTVYALFYGLGIHVKAFVILLGLTTTKIVSLLPFLPGALILYEGSMSFFFASLGIPLGSAIVVTLLYRLFSFWLPMPAGLLLYRKWITTSGKENQ